LRKSIFRDRAFLDEQIPLRIKYQNVDGAMFQATGMRFGARRLPNHAITIIHNVE
jgi:hypothetical protein